MTPTARDRAKAQRRSQILRAAAELFARYGYGTVSLQTVGEHAGISGPGVYRHFDSKQELLSELLVGISHHLLSGANTIRARHGDTERAMSELISFHVDFALTDPYIIRVHERDFGSLDREDRAAVRTAQREYMGQWQQILTELQPLRDPQENLTRVFGVAGLINSTAYSRARAAASTDRVGAVLVEMAHLALELDLPPGAPSTDRPVPTSEHRQRRLP